MEVSTRQICRTTLPLLHNLMDIVKVHLFFWYLLVRSKQPSGRAILLSLFLGTIMESFLAVNLWLVGMCLAR